MIEIKHKCGESNITLDGEAALVMAECVSCIRAMYAGMLSRDRVLGEIFREYLTDKMTSGELFVIDKADIKQK